MRAFPILPPAPSDRRSHPARTRLGDALYDPRPPRRCRRGHPPPGLRPPYLSLDDRFLYVSCWGTGELRQYDVTDPHDPRLTGSARLGGIVRRSAHLSQPGKPLNGDSQMVEISRDGRRVYLTNSLYSPWDAQFYPDGIRGWMAKLDVKPEGGIAFDDRFLLEFEDGHRPHQVRLEGGDASSDSFCYS